MSLNMFARSPFPFPNVVGFGNGGNPNDAAPQGLFGDSQFGFAEEAGLPEAGLPEAGLPEAGLPDVGIGVPQDAYGTGVYGTRWPSGATFLYGPPTLNGKPIQIPLGWVLVSSDAPPQIFQNQRSPGEEAAFVAPDGSLHNVVTDVSLGRKRVFKAGPRSGVIGMGGSPDTNIFGLAITDATQIGDILYQGLTGQDPNVTATLEQAGSAALGDITGGLGGTGVTVPSGGAVASKPAAPAGSSGLGTAGLLLAGVAALFLLKKR